MADVPHRREENLDDFFDAVGSKRPGAIRQAANQVVQGEENANTPSAPATAPKDLQSPQRKKTESPTDLFKDLDRLLEAAGNMPEEPAPASDSPNNAQSAPATAVPPPVTKDIASGKFIAVEPSTVTTGDLDPDAAFVLIPAHIHQYVPWWGWMTIALGLLVMVIGVILMPLVRLERTTAQLADPNETVARHAMQQLVRNGNEQTVKKLFGMATSDKQKISARLRAVDTMSLIERVPEVDRALLRLELSSQTNPQIREAATAARKQREAYKTRGGEK